MSKQPTKRRKTGRDWEFKVSRKFCDRKDLSGYAKWIAVCLRGWADKYGYAEPTMPQIAERCGFSVDTVEKYLFELKSKQVIEWIVFRDDKKHKRRRYFLGVNMPTTMGDATPYAHGGPHPPLTSTSLTREEPDSDAEENPTLYDFDQNFHDRSGKWG